LHWLVFGLALIIVELFLWSMFLLWIGASAITISIVFYLYPEVSWGLQVLSFILLSVVSTFLAKKYFPVKTVDDVLNLQVTDLLARRLQTIAQRKLYFKTPYQARQAIVHGHIMIGDSVITIPSYIVKTEEEEKIRLIPESRFNETLSKPESDLGRPETENLEAETGDQSKNEEPAVKQDAEKESPVKQDAEKASTE